MDISILLSGESKNLDNLANSLYSLGDHNLIENAGRACAMLLVDRKLINSKQKILVLSGAGNNGADGLVIARALLGIGYDPIVYEIRGHTENDLRKLLREQFQEVGGKFLTLDLSVLADIEKVGESYDVLIDSLTGTGFKGEASENALKLVNNINTIRQKFGIKVISIDVPSYNDSDSLEDAASTGIIADTTISIQTLKRIHVDPNKIGIVGEVFLVDVGIPVRQNFKQLQLSQQNDFISSAKVVFREPSTIHKGNRPRILIVGGSQGKEGAAILAGLGALRAGASLVTIASCSENVSQLMKPEMMFHNLTLDQDHLQLKDFVKKSSSVVIGPGLGVSEISLVILNKVLSSCKQFQIPLLIDADAVILLGNNHSKFKSMLPEKLVLTPHPKEFTFLSPGKSVQEILKDRFEISKEVAKMFAATVVLKGPRTLISNQELQRVNPHIVPALAIGGSGDVLSGIISAILPRLDSVLDAVSLGVYLHGEAGSLLQAKLGTNIGALASEIADEVPYVISLLSNSEVSREFYKKPFA